MKFEVRNRFSGAIQFTADIECDESASLSVKLGLAVQWAYKSGADLNGADLSSAYLRGAYLNGANLSGANLNGGKLAAGESLAMLGYPDGWRAYTYFTDRHEQRVSVGCQDLSLAAGRAYWAGKDNRREVMAALDFAEAIGRVRGWVKVEQQAA